MVFNIRRGTWAAIALLLAISGFSQSVHAQREDMDTIVDGFDNPRNVAFDSDGVMYIVDAGSAGELETTVSFLGEGTTGATGKLYAYSPEGELSVVAYGFPSTLVIGEVHGLHDLIVTDDVIWLAQGQASDRGADVPHNPFAYYIYQLDRETMNIREAINMWEFEEANNPDGNETDSNPISIDMADDGTLYILDAGANSSYTWTPDQGLEVFVAWPDAPVPTAVDVAPSGEIYFSFFSPEPFEPGSARIERYSSDGELLETYGDLSMLVDVLVDEAGNIYATQMTEFDQENQTFLPNSGRLIRVAPDGERTVIADGLNFPNGLAWNPEGELMMTINAAFVEEANGAVVIVPLNAD